MASPGVTLVPAPQEEDHPEQLTSLEACVGLPWILTTETPGWTQVINTISKETFGIVLRAELISGVSSLLLCDPRGESPAWHPHVLPTVNTATGREASPLGLSTPAGSHTSEASAALQQEGGLHLRSFSCLALEPTGERGRPSRCSCSCGQRLGGPDPGRPSGPGLPLPTDICSSLLLWTMSGG